MELIYKQGVCDPSELSDFARELLQEVRNRGKVQDEARAAGIDVDALLDDSTGAQEILIEAAGSGFDPVTVTLFVTFSSQVAIDLWRRLVLPRIERKWGATALGPQVQQHDETPGEGE